jgi:hypothetical protein
MQNESRSERKPETEPTQEESIKSSKLARIGNAATMVGIFLIPTAVTVAATVVSYKTGKMNFDSAKLNLETAKIANLAQKAVQS